MNTPQHLISPVLPLGWHLSWLSKLYFGALTMKLGHLDIDRYFVVLLLLDSKSAPMCQQELCDILHIDKTYMVKVVNYLQKYGYITKTTSGKDRRRQLITLTEKGVKQIPEIQHALKEIDQKIREEMGSKDFKHLQSCISGIADGLMALPRRHVTLNYKSSKK
jgi:DNA-binding MarR family transcriptional regulator